MERSIAGVHFQKLFEYHVAYVRGNSFLFNTGNIIDIFTKQGQWSVWRFVPVSTAIKALASVP